MKCQRGYQNHHAPDCPNDFPDGKNYKELTEDFLLSHKRLTNVPANAQPVRVVASSSRVKEYDKGDTSFVAVAIMLSAVLGSGSESEEEVSTLLTVPHLHWDCSLMGPEADEPLTVTSMLDCGAHVVPIDSSLVESLGLHRFHLHRPLPISIAMNNTSTSDTHLYEYVKIVPYTVDSTWTSRTIRAVITPMLCVPLPLGLPFLTVNQIVADFKQHSVIDKSSNYDLLHPTVHKN